MEEKKIFGIFIGSTSVSYQQHKHNTVPRKQATIQGYIQGSDLHRYGSDQGEEEVLETSLAWEKERKVVLLLPCVSGHMGKLANAFKLFRTNKKYSVKLKANRKLRTISNFGGE